MVPKHTWIIVFSAAILAVSACSERSQERVGLPGLTSSDVARAPAERAAPVARAIARALARVDLRKQVLVDLRDSPFPGHKIHLASYLAGFRGRELARASAAAAGVSTETFLAAVRQLPETEFWMARPLDRTQWTGTPDVVVAGTTRSNREVALVGQVAGFDTAGMELQIPVDGAYFARPMLLIVPVQTGFGADPESLRAAAPHRDRTTISTINTEFGTTCDPMTSVTECDGGGSGEGSGSGGGTPGTVPGIQLPMDITLNDCTTDLSADADMDGFNDECEYQLAYAFRPLLRVSYRDDHLARDPYWSVKYDPTTARVHIFYALAYLRDGGSKDLQVGAHNGDSEWIILEVHHVMAGQWQMDYGRLSAHWGEPLGIDASGRWSYQDFTFSLGSRGRPDVWVAEEKHANYNTQAHCDVGSYNTDTCDENTMLQEPLVSRQRNVGNSAPVGTWTHDCVSTTLNNYGRVECFWAPWKSEFAGWQQATDGAAGPYRNSLGAYGF
jgi:hypothetical protein